MTSVMTSLAAYTAAMYAITLVLINIIIFGSRNGIIETACLTRRNYNIEKL